jgi:A118 family predicted phage portal protein
MALPPSGQVWPPQNMHTILPQLGLWSAWYSGSSDQLSSVYGGATGSDPSATGFFASDHGGFRATVGRALTRWFWGEATRGPDRRTKVHVPIGAELCQASADLLFADQVSLTVDNAETAGEATQARLDALTGDGLHAEFAEAAEIAAALGGVYLRVTWDTTLLDEPFITHIDADQALPEFRWGRLSAVTFWQVVARDGKHVFRHLERHETDMTGRGIILHGLYMGEEDKLGYQIPLNTQTATAPLLTLGEQSGYTVIVDSQSKGLCVEYVPNQTPNRIWRTDPLGRHFGRSDLDGVEQLMDALDETMSSWMRDIRLGKARIMVAKTLLDNVGPGNGRAFDAQQEVYAPVNTLAGKDQPLSAQIQSSQFAIRFAEHKATADDLIEKILDMAGYSPQTFGVGDTGTVRTATEIESRERRSLMTRKRKLRHWRPALKNITEKLLAVDRAIFGTANVFTEVEVKFADGVQETQLSLAETALAMFQAQSASTAVRVGLLHPDWDDDDIDAEVALINAENAIGPDPMVPPDLKAFDGMAGDTMGTGDMTGGMTNGGPAA